MLDLNAITEFVIEISIEETTTLQNDSSAGFENNFGQLMLGDFYLGSKFYKSCESTTINDIIMVKSYIQREWAPLKGKEVMLAITGEPQDTKPKWSVLKKPTDDNGIAIWQFEIKDLGLDLTDHTGIFMYIIIEPYGPLAMGTINIK